MDDNQNNSQAEPVVSKSNIDYKVLAGVVVLFFIAIYVVMNLNGVKPAPVVEETASTEGGADVVTSTAEVTAEPLRPRESGMTEEVDMTVAETINFHIEQIIAKGGFVTEVVKSGNRDAIIAETANLELYVVYVEEVEGKTMVTIVTDAKQ